MDPNDEPNLKDIIRRISNELIASQAERRGAGDAAVFEVSSLDIELNFVITRSKSGKGEIDLKVVRGGGERRYDTQQVQRLVLHLTAPVAGRSADDTYPFYDPVSRVLPRRILPEGEENKPGRADDGPSRIADNENATP